MTIRSLLAALILGGSGAFAVAETPPDGVALTPEEYHEGIEYKKIVPRQPTKAADGQVEVVELFWYGCPACYKLEPDLKAWLKNKPKHVVFLRMPAQFYPQWVAHARAYYTAEALGILEQVHGPLFDAIHQQRKPLNNPQALANFFAQYGVSAKRFHAVYDSPAVSNKISHAKGMVQRYGAEGVPTIVVNGKYLTSRGKSFPGVSDYKEMLRIVDFLIRKETPPPAAAAPAQ